MKNGKDHSKPKICIIGSGFVGQATGKGFVTKGFDVTFLDINIEKVKHLRNEGYKAYQPDELVNGKFDFDISFLTVPTPTENGNFKYDYLKSAAEYLGKKLYVLNKYHVAVVKSTVLPGTTENLVLKTIERYSRRKAGKDFGVSMNPEYLRERYADEDFLNSWIVVVGALDAKSGKSIMKLYEDFDCPKYLVSLKEAEIQKYVHNLFNAAKITFFNEMRSISRKLDIDPEVVFPTVTLSAEGIWNPMYGVKDKGPFSGNCLPKDTQAFLSWIESQGLKADLLKTTIKVNQQIEKEYQQRDKNSRMRKHRQNGKHLST